MNNIELYCSDCLEVMKDIPDKSINLVLIDPPYNIGKDKWDKWKTVEDYVEFMGKVFLEIQRVLKDNGSFYFFHNDFLQIVELQNFINKNTEFKFKQMLTWEKYQTNKQYYGRNVLMFVNAEHKRNYRSMCEYILYYTFQDETGLNKIKSDINNFKTLRNYSKNLQDYIGLTRGQINKKLKSRKAEHFFYHSSTQWDLCTEEVYNLLIENFDINKWEKFRTYESLRDEYKSLRDEYESLRDEYEKNRYTFNVFDKDKTTTFLIPPAPKQGHLTPKPVDLLKYIIKTSSNENDIVLDCFMGSGSTGVACKHTNRKFIGIELDEKYFELAKKRIEEE